MNRTPGLASLALAEASRPVGPQSAVARLREDEAEVNPIGETKAYRPDAWFDHSRTKIGYEIPFTRHFYEYVPPRPVAEIDAELQQIEKQIQELLGGLARGHTQ